MDKITLRNMKFFGFHGCEDFEKSKGQAFEIDAELYIDTRAAGQSDKLVDAVNYAEIFGKIKKVMENERYDLLERVAERVSEKILEDVRIQSIILRVRKPAVPLQGFLDCVELEIARERVS